MGHSRPLDPKLDAEALAKLGAHIERLETQNAELVKALKRWQEFAGKWQSDIYHWSPYGVYPDLDQAHAAGGATLIVNALTKTEGL